MKEELTRADIFEPYGYYNKRIGGQSEGLYNIQYPQNPFCT